MFFTCDPEKQDVPQVILRLFAKSAPNTNHNAQN